MNHLPTAEPAPSGGECGFTLLEVLVALAIALPALLLLYRQGAFALEMTDTAATYAEAVSRARSRLDALVDTSLQPGERSGDDGGRYRWRTQITPLSTSARRADAARSLYAAGTTLYAVRVEIAWSGPTRSRAVVLDTRRLGPAVTQSP